MNYSEKINGILRSAGIEVGDEVEVRIKTRIHKGILMPHHEFSGEAIITIKLSNGYNIGVALDPEMEIKLSRKRHPPAKHPQTIRYDKNKPMIAILSTGGTIASYVDYRTGAVHPAMTAEDLAYSAPELYDLCNVRAKVLYSILSENMKVGYWQQLAREIAREFKEGVEGVIVPHGTDTIGFTSAALSFMLRNLPGPVVLVGSQRSSDRPSSDASINLISAVQLFTNSDLGEVVVVMHGETSDSYATIHRGTRVRKMHTSRRDAFRSINENPLGTIRGNEINLSNDYIKKNDAGIVLKDEMEERVCLLYFYPGLTPEHLSYVSERNKGIVIAGTGLGHVSSDLLDDIKNNVENGIPVVMTSQCLYGRVNMNVYSVGRDMLKLGVISGEDMLPETAYVKLMWVLGQTQDMDEVKELILSNMVDEIGDRKTID